MSCWSTAFRLPGVLHVRDSRLKPVLQRSIRLLTALLICLAISASASAQGWGHLRGKFVLDGKAPAPRRLVVGAGAAALCAPDGAGPFDDSLLVGKENEIANVVVSLVPDPDKKPAIHKDYDAAMKKPVEFDIKLCMFEPHIQTVRVGQDLILKNSDVAGHAMKGDLQKAPFADLIPAKASIKKVFKVEERLPAPVNCLIHPWMRAYLIVRDDPYIAVSARDGTFEIRNLPAGDWTFRAWHERSGWVKEVKIDGKAIQWEKGQFSRMIDDGKDVDLGEVHVSLTELSK